MLWLHESFFKAMQRQCNFFKTVALLSQATGQLKKNHRKNASLFQASKTKCGPFALSVQEW